MFETFPNCVQTYYLHVLTFHIFLNVLFSKSGAFVFILQPSPLPLLAQPPTHNPHTLNNTHQPPLRQKTRSSPFGDDFAGQTKLTVLAGSNCRKDMEDLGTGLRKEIDRYDGIHAARMEAYVLMEKYESGPRDGGPAITPDGKQPWMCLGQVGV